MYTVDSITSLLNDNRFEVVEVTGDLIGIEYFHESNTIGIIAKKYKYSQKDFDDKKIILLVFNYNDIDRSCMKLQIDIDRSCMNLRIDISKKYKYAILFIFKKFCV